MIGVHLMIDGVVRRMPTEAEIRELLSEMPAAIGMRVLDGMTEVDMKRKTDLRKLETYVV